LFAGALSVGMLANQAATLYLNRWDSTLSRPDQCTTQKKRKSLGRQAENAAAPPHVTAR